MTKQNQEKWLNTNWWMLLKLLGHACRKPGWHKVSTRYRKPGWHKVSTRYRKPGWHKVSTRYSNMIMSNGNFESNTGAFWFIFCHGWIGLFGFMVFDATFNNISVILWWSVLLMGETKGPGENTNLTQVTDKLYHIILYTSPWAGFALAMSVVIGTDCIGSYKSNYHTITATTAPGLIVSDQGQVRLHLWTYFLVQIYKNNNIFVSLSGIKDALNAIFTSKCPPYWHP